VKSFFSRMSFPRAVILFCSLGSLALGALVYLRSQRLAEVQQELRRVPELVREIHTNAYRLAHLQRSATSEKFKGQSELETYIRGVAADGKINIGQVDFRKNERTPAKNVTDTVYTITPKAKTQRFTLGQVGNFLYKLEADSRRVKVTRIKLTPFEKVSPGEVGKEYWVFEVDVTTRTKQETAPSQG